VNAFLGDRVKEGQVLAVVESRQPGNPPPTIELKAVHDGLVIESHVLQGQPVQPDMELFDISDRNEMWVVAQIPEQLAAGIGPGTKARISFPALGGEPIMAELMRFGVQADREAGAVQGVFQVPNKEGQLQPGMRAEFSIIVNSRPNVLSVPEDALQGDPAARVVYVKDFDLPNAFVRAPVVVGKKGGGWVEVIEGLFPGDEVVTRGSYSLGFVGGGAGPSLKEALDAAHGHEHAEDGSEPTEGAKSGGEENDGEHAHEEGGGAPKWLIYYAIGSSLIMLLLAQMVWNSKRRATPTV
jgi:multidrug efflux pump subunit AcrA (membrane-fusion protein)